jgi:hypothetical protein
LGERAGERRWAAKKKKRPAAWLALGLEREAGWAEKKERERKGRD